MNHFCIIANTEKDMALEMSEEMKEYLLKHKKECLILEGRGKAGNGISFTIEDDIPDTVDCAIVLGGDGTIIQAADDLVHKDIPILAINMGTLGYLAEVDIQSYEASLDRLFQNDCYIEHRMMLHGTVQRYPSEDVFAGHAINDIVVTKRGSCRIIEIHLWVNEELIDTYVADGLIVSTPTGSTGYNLSAGGPVMAPSLQAIVITPICPHSLNNRSLVINPADQVELEIGKSKKTQEEEAYAIFDGEIVEKLHTGDRVRIHKALEETKFIKLNSNSFYSIMRNKLGKE